MLLFIRGKGSMSLKIGQISVSWGILRSSTKNISHLIKHWARLYSNNKAITNLLNNKTWYAHWVASLVADSPETFSHQDRPDQQSVHLANLNSMPTASSFRCGEDREARRRHACTQAALMAAHQRMVQKNFFSRKGFSEAGTGTMRGSSRMCASQYAIRSAAALETWNVEDVYSDYIFSYSDTYFMWVKSSNLAQGSSSFSVISPPAAF